MLNLKDPAKRAEWVYGQPMAPCPKCGSYNMKPQIPIALETTGDETAQQLVGKWARATKAGATPVQGPAYYCCWDCFHKGPAVDCTGRTSEDCRADRALNADMKRLWNAQTPNRETGSNLKAPAPNPKTEADAARKKSFCGRMQGVVDKASGPAERAKAALKRWKC